MNTLQINSKAAQVLSNAAAKARTEKPLVKKTHTYGWYMVRSATDMTRWYSVICDSQTKEITCNCPARKPCYHIAAVAPIHSWIARQRRDQAAQALAEAETEAANWPLPVERSEVPNFDNEAPASIEASWPVSEIEEFIAESQALTWSDEETEQALAQLPAYTPALEAKDHDDIFGFAPVRRERVKEEW